MRFLLAMILGGFSIALPATKATAVEIEMFFLATIDEVVDIEEGEAQIGDQVEGYIYFETSTPESTAFPNNYFNAITGFDIYINPQSGPNAGLSILTLSDSGVGDAFVSADEFGFDYFVDIFTGNFQVSLSNGPAFNNSLVNAGNLLVQATDDSPFGDALDAFVDPFDNSSFTFQTDYTFGNAFATYDFLQFTVVPEPGSVALLAIGGLCVARRKR